MHLSSTRWLRLASVSAAVSLLAACGSDNGSGSDGHVAASHDATAVSANVPQSAALSAKGATNKVNPVVRPGAEAPLDSTPDTRTNPLPIDRLAPPDTATLKFASGFESGVALTEPTGFRSGNRQLVGTDIAGYAFPMNLSSAPSDWRSGILSTVREVTQAPVTDFLTASIKSVAAHSGGLTNALSLHSKVQSGDCGFQEIAVQNVGMVADASMYQRMWIKFDAATRARAQAAGSTNFDQTFWEATATPDYRIRLNLRYDDSLGLYWQAKTDVPAGGAATAWESDLKTAPVMIAPSTSAEGWHKVEIWIDLTQGRFKVAIDRQVLADRTGDLIGARGDSQKRTGLFKMMMVHSDVAPLAEVLFDDLEIWNTPPANAW